MNYALIENGVVANIISLNPNNATDFPNAISLEGRPVQIGDAYMDGIFYRDGEPVLTPMEALRAELVEMAELVVDLEIENAILGMGGNPDDL